MKICLVAINSKYIHTSPAVDLLKAYANAKMIPAGSLSFTINQPEEQILGHIYEEKADVYCFSVYVWNVEIVLRTVRNLKKILPQAEIWLGGPEASFRSEELLKEYHELRGIMRGEGEETFACLASKVYGKETDLSALPEIEGISWRSDGEEILSTKDRTPMDMDRIVFPYFGTEADPNRIYYYESTRGCPFGCIYCLSSLDKKLRAKSLEKVFSELDWFLESRVKQVKFVDRTFNTDKERSIAIWKFLKEHDNGVTNFHFEICAELLSKEELNFLATLRPGQVQFEIGVQTTNFETLKAIRRMRDEEKLTENVAALLSPRNIHIHLDLIAGLPYEDLESFKESFNRVAAMEPLQLQLGFLKILHGTPMEVFALREGFLYRSTPPYEILENRWICYEELLLLKKVEEMVEVYYNSHQFEKTLTAMKELGKQKGYTPFDLFLKLSVFHESKGYDRMDHGRMERYGILLEFVLSEGWEREVFVPLLLEDFLSRERLKHWPEWAGNAMKPEGFDYEHRDPLTGNATRI